MLMMEGVQQKTINLQSCTWIVEIAEAFYEEITLKELVSSEFRGMGDDLIETNPTVKHWTGWMRSYSLCLERMEPVAKNQVAAELRWNFFTRSIPKVGNSLS